MTKIASVSFETKCIAYLCAVARNNEGEITRRSQSTGFFWRHKGIPFLVTNRHCVTGRDGNNKPLSGGFDPTGLQVSFRVPHERIEEDAHSYKNRHIEFKLWEDGSPSWKEHPTGSTVDLVALELRNFDADVHCINDKIQVDHWMPEVGIDCFIVGFPEKLSGSEGTPIWKRASIASEPELEIDGLPIFLCDSATRQGMSGAPVFAKLLGNFGREGQPFSDNEALQFFGHWTKFLGVYSGRNGDIDYGFQLGRVWKAGLLSEVLENPETPESSFVSQ